MVRKIGTEHIAVLALALVGCRAVIGIEELRVADDASVVVDGSGPDGGVDVVVVDSGADVAVPDGSEPTLGACNLWCRTDGGAGAGASAFSAEMRSCMCEGGTLKACGSECVGLCPNGTPPSPNCETCMLRQVLEDSGVCVAKVAGCTSPCQSFVQCVKGCL